MRFEVQVQPLLRGFCLINLWSRSLSLLQTRPAAREFPFPAGETEAGNPEVPGSPPQQSTVSRHPFLPEASGSSIRRVDTEEGPWGCSRDPVQPPHTQGFGAVPPAGTHTLRGRAVPRDSVWPCFLRLMRTWAGLSDVGALWGALQNPCRAWPPSVGAAGFPPQCPPNGKVS